MDLHFLIKKKIERPRAEKPHVSKCGTGHQSQTPERSDGWCWKRGRTWEEAERGDSEGQAEQEMGVSCSWSRGGGSFPPPRDAQPGFPCSQAPLCVFGSHSVLTSQDAGDLCIYSPLGEVNPQRPEFL